MCITTGDDTVENNNERNVSIARMTPAEVQGLSAEAVEKLEIQILPPPQGQVEPRPKQISDILISEATPELLEEVYRQELVAPRTGVTQGR
jgi:hypothetical protein